MIINSYYVVSFPHSLRKTHQTFLSSAPQRGHLKGYGKKYPNNL